jgi:hypothetical protein
MAPAPRRRGLASIRALSRRGPSPSTGSHAVGVRGVGLRGPAPGGAPDTEEFKMICTPLLDKPATEAEPVTPGLDPKMFGRYADEAGPRELRCFHLADGRRLLIDWRVPDHADPRLVGLLGEEEPSTNEHLLSRLYLADPNHGRCRPLAAADLLHEDRLDPGQGASPSNEPLRDAEGAAFQLTQIDTERSYIELRWTRLPLGRTEPLPISLREAVGYLEAYEPVCSLTRRAIADHTDRAEVSTRCLRQELSRVEQSPIVLNRALREAVLVQTQQGLSFSEIAMRCGRSKARHGTTGGDASWLARRIGLMPEAGGSRPTPWVHSDVLALVARQGLGVCPMEVEVP